MRFGIVLDPRHLTKSFRQRLRERCWIVGMFSPFSVRSKRRRLQDSCTSQRDSCRVIVNEYLLWGDTFAGLPQVWVINAVPDRLAREQRGPEASHQKLPAETS